MKTPDQPDFPRQTPLGARRVPHCRPCPLPLPTHRGTREDGSQDCSISLFYALRKVRRNCSFQGDYILVLLGQDFWTWISPMKQRKAPKENRDPKQEFSAEVAARETLGVGGSPIWGREPRCPRPHSRPACAAASRHLFPVV